MRFIPLSCALLLLACEGGTEPAVSPALDQGGRDAVTEPVSDGAITPDAGAVDAEPEAAIDAAVDAESADVGPPPESSVCPDIESPRPAGAVRVAGCRLTIDGPQIRPRAVVVSGDSLTRVAGTPFHEPAQYADLARAGVDWVWLLIRWDGIEPQAGTYNSAYQGRICEHTRWAAEAGLSVVWSLYQERFGPAAGGFGMPDWLDLVDEPVPEGAGPDDPTLRGAWRSFWASSGPDALEAAWLRLFETCITAESPGPIGVHPLAEPLGESVALERYGALHGAVTAGAEAAFGPLLRFESPLISADGPLWLDAPGPDRVRVAPGWGPGRGPAAALVDPAEALLGARDAAWADGRPLFVTAAGGVDAPAAAAHLAAIEATGLPLAVWQDGFGSPYGLRDADGQPTALFDLSLRRPGPLSISGRLIEWRAESDATRLRWLTDTSDGGLSRIALGEPPTGEPRLEPAGPFDWFTDFDPATGLLTVFVDGAVGVVTLTVPQAPEKP